MLVTRLTTRVHAWPLAATATRVHREEQVSGEWLDLEKQHRGTHA